MVTQEHGHGRFPRALKSGILPRKAIGRQGQGSMPKEKSKAKIDTAWFKARIRDVYGHGGQRLLAKELGIDPSQVSRLLNGTRKMESIEAVLIADFIKQPLSEVMIRAGADKSLTKKTTT